MADGYDLGAVLDTPESLAVPAGTSVLVQGPAQSGKYRLALDLLAAGHDDGEGALVVTTDDRASTVRRQFDDRAAHGDDDRLAVVECRNVESERVDEDTALTKHVQSPSNLTEIGVEIVSCMDTFERRDVERVRLLFTSLTTMLSFSDPQTIFKFCHVLTARLDDAGYLGIFTIDTGVHEPRTVNMMKRAFDVLVEIRESSAGSREVRISGFADEPVGWLPL